MSRENRLPTRHLRAEFHKDTFEQLKEIKGNRSWREAIIEEFGIADGGGDSSD